MSLITSAAVTEEDLDFIDAILEKYETEESIVSVSELDGFLTAIVSGPDMIMPSEWLPEIWGGEQLSPEWESKEEFSRFIGIVMSIMNNNAQTLTEQPEEFEAMFLIDMENGEPVEVVTLWCYGYIRAVAMRPRSWLHLPADIEEHLGHITLFGSATSEETLEKLSEDIITELKTQIEPAARAIHAYWLAQRAPAAPPAPKPMRSVTKVGRNEPCPCGSGKKFKHCCLH